MARLGFERLETRALLAVLSIELVSAADPALVAGDSSLSSLSADDRFVAFTSTASNLVIGDTNGQSDVFIEDRTTGAITRVSTDSQGYQANGLSSGSSISADGRYVAFCSNATNLVSGDTNGHTDVFVKDLTTGTTARVSTDGAGNQANNDCIFPSISDDGRYVAFVSCSNNLVSFDTNDVADVFVRDVLLGTTTRVSTTSAGQQSSGPAENADISADGRYVAFSSDASNMVRGDTNGKRDVFVKDLSLGITMRVSTDSAGGQANDNSSAPNISGDGRYVAFYSGATNLVSGDTNEKTEVFVKDLNTGITTRVSTDSVGNQANDHSSTLSISADGQYVAFGSAANNLVDGDTNAVSDIFVKNLNTGITTRVSTDSLGGQANRGSDFPHISVTGRYVTFQSSATNLVSGDTNGLVDAFVKDVVTGATTSASLRNSDIEYLGGNSASGFSRISSDGRYVAFQSYATNLVTGDTNGKQDIFVRDVVLGTTTRVSTDSAGAQSSSYSESPSISGDGRYVAFSNVWVYVKDRTTGITTLAHTDSAGHLGDMYSEAPAISGDGRHVAFSSNSNNLASGSANGLWDIFAKDLTSGATTWVNTHGSNGMLPNLQSIMDPSISDDGRYVAFGSLSNLVSADPDLWCDIFVNDRVTGITTLISSDGAGTPGNTLSISPSISGDGRYVAFASNATNLVSGDTNGYTDVFVKDRVTGATTRVSTDSAGNQGIASPYMGYGVSISADGRYVAFASCASNLVSGDTNGTCDIFVKDRLTGTTMRVNMGSDGCQANGPSYYPSISSDGQYVVFESSASNLHPNDSSHVTDIFRVTLDIASPSVTFSGISTPRTQPVGSEGITFTEPVTGFDIGDLVLTRNASPVTLAAGMLSGSGANYSLDLSTVTTLDGTYSLTLSAPGGIADMAGHSLAAGHTVSWVMNTTPVAAPDAYQVPEDGSLQVAAPGLLANDSAPGGGSLIAVLRSGPSHGSLTLFADGSFLYSPQHDYHGPDNFTYAARNAGGIDSNVASVSITVTPVADVSGRHVFYNHSAWDGNDAGATVADYNAIAPLPEHTGHGHAGELDEPAKELGKQALLPGQTASFVHYTSYAKGLNGIFVVFDDLPDPQSLAATDFVFRVGNDDAPAGWPAAPAPLAIRVDEDVEHPSFTGHPDVVTITWADEDPYTTPREAGAISNQWLQVTVLAGARTGLAADDVFYFGNQIGESGNSASDTNVDQNDEIGARNHPHTAFNPASLRDPYDFNRDGKVDQNDEILARNNPASAFTRIRRIAAPSPLQAVSAAAGADATRGLLTPDALAPVVTEAFARWRAKGLSTEQRQPLPQTPFVIASLGGRELGVASGRSKTVWVDDEGAGLDWLIAPTSAPDEAFAQGSSAEAACPTHGRIDRLTVVTHEPGHVFGRADVDGLTEDLMAARLANGIRRGLSANFPNLHDTVLAMEIVR